MDSTYLIFVAKYLMYALDKIVPLYNRQPDAGAGQKQNQIQLLSYPLEFEPYQLLFANENAIVMQCYSCLRLLFPIFNNGVGEFDIISLPGQWRQAHIDNG